jgi:hypothetical protein
LTSAYIIANSIGSIYNGVEEAFSVIYYFYYLVGLPSQTDASNILNVVTAQFISDCKISIFCNSD